MGVEVAAVSALLGLALAGRLALADTSSVTPTEAEIYRAAIYLEGELGACEARETGLRRLLRARSSSTALALTDAPPPIEGPGWLIPAALGASAGLGIGLVLGVILAR
jgi:hypothetical protein